MMASPHYGCSGEVINFYPFYPFAIFSALRVKLFVGICLKFRCRTGSFSFDQISIGDTKKRYCTKF